MLSIRSFARAAPRTVSRLAGSAISRSARRPVSLLQSTAFKPARTQFAAAFHTTRIQQAKAGEVDDELAAKLESEIQTERNLKDESSIPMSVKEFTENGNFEILDTPGQEEVVLTRTFGDEKIQVTFSIADLNLDPESDYPDAAMADESENINQGSNKSFKQAPEDQVDEDAEEGAEAAGEASYPSRLNIIIEKSGKGAMVVEAIAQDDMIIIDNVFYFSDAAHAYAKTPEKVQERQDLYVGPPFGNLDEELQESLERYLDERGINPALALFVPDYIDMKEQKEYVRWLENVKGFVEA